METELDTITNIKTNIFYNTIATAQAIIVKAVSSVTHSLFTQIFRLKSRRISMQFVKCFLSKKGSIHVCIKAALNHEKSCSKGCY